MMVRTKAKAKKVRTPHILVPPTPERLAKADPFIHRSATGPFMMMDSPLERLHARKRITDAQYNAGVKFRHHWTHAGIKERYASLNLSGVFGGGSSEPLPVTAAAQHHYDRYREAVQALGLDLSDVTQKICCDEINATEIAKKRGYRDHDYGASVVLKLLDEGLTKLCKVWGMG